MGGPPLEASVSRPSRFRRSGHALMPASPLSRGRRRHLKTSRVMVQHTRHSAGKVGGLRLVSAAMRSAPRFRPQRGRDGHRGRGVQRRCPGDATNPALLARAGRAGRMPLILGRCSPRATLRALQATTLFSSITQALIPRAMEAAGVTAPCWTVTGLRCGATARRSFRRWRKSFSSWFSVALCRQGDPGRADQGFPDARTGQSAPPGIPMTMP